MNRCYGAGWRVVISKLIKADRRVASFEYRWSFLRNVCRTVITGIVIERESTELRPKRFIGDSKCREGSQHLQTYLQPMTSDNGRFKSIALPHRKRVPRRFLWKNVERKESGRKRREIAGVEAALPQREKGNPSRGLILGARVTSGSATRFSWQIESRRPKRTNTNFFRIESKRFVKRGHPWRVPFLDSTIFAHEPALLTPTFSLSLSREHFLRIVLTTLRNYQSTQFLFLIPRLAPFPHLF